mmetsp:Transcript_15171/g.26803  ORF Transcript_15171/g.26803 Transcript_15171/m.26803 type:complete len:206 (+) Transcript_15171:3-620(+)
MMMALSQHVHLQELVTAEESEVLDWALRLCGVARAPTNYFCLSFAMFFCTMCLDTGGKSAASLASFVYLFTNLDLTSEATLLSSMMPLCNSSASGLRVRSDFKRLSISERREGVSATLFELSTVFFVNSWSLLAISCEIVSSTSLSCFKSSISLATSSNVTRSQAALGSKARSTSRESRSNVDSYTLMSGSICLTMFSISSSKSS